MATDTPLSQPRRPENGTQRAARVAILYALVRAYPDRRIERLRDGLGWTVEEMDQALTDVKVVYKELSISA